jgi:hypothetical protein
MPENAIPCGEGACSRSAAQQSQMLNPRDLKNLGLLRNPAGASSLATEALSNPQRRAAMASTDSRISAGPL